MNSVVAQTRVCRTALLALAASLATIAAAGTAHAVEPMQVGFLWHMHQPIYYPGETITQTDAAGHYSFSVTDVHNQRFGPYTSWPKDAIQAGLALAHLGAQVSFSGSLMSNLNRLEAAGVNGGMWNNWEASYKTAAQLDTTLGNPRLDLVGFGNYHSLMPLLDERDMRMQIKLHKYNHEQTWGPNVPYSKGFFPPETAFSERMIPALVAEGIEWSIVDNIHFDRATQNYPHTNSSNLYAPNRADQVNPDPAASGGAWIQLNNLWAPSKVSAPFSYQPHHVQYVNPATGSASRLVAVPAARYEGNEDGRGGFGALQYEQVMDQYRQYNTDPAHPLLVVLHHDGDNFGGGSESYYHSNFQNMVSWAAANPNYDVTTIQDYLERYPVAVNDVIHVENGSWAGADNGDPEFKKWLGDPNTSGWSPDRNSWAVLTAAKNRVFTADDIAPATSIANIAAGVGTPTERAWRYLMEAEASDYWYWDGTEVWDSNVTRGSNLAVAQANQVLSGFQGVESTPPTIFLPQRDIYNPGGLEWSTTPEPSDFEVWTYAYDVSGLTNVTLKYRIDADGQNPLASLQNETYAGGAEVGAWSSVTMTATDVAPPPGIAAPTYRALRHGGMIAGVRDALVDYYVEAVDALGNIARSDIQHVYVGSAVLPPGGTPVTMSPDPAQAGQLATITYDPAGRALAGSAQVYMHYGFNEWATVLPDVAMTYNSGEAHWSASVPIVATANQLDVVFNNGAGTWDNNNGQDWHFTVQGAVGPSFVLDGQLDASAQLVATNGGRQIYAAVRGATLYVATEDAGEGQDVFLYVADQPGALRAANWGKAGQVADWDAFLADENNNDYESWFDAAGVAIAATGTNGGVLEGTLDLSAEYGANIPSTIYLAVGLFASADGGALVHTLQVPASLNSNGNIDASEFARFAISTTPGDFNRDGLVNLADLSIWRGSVGGAAAGDADGDGDSDGADFLVWQRNLGHGSATNVVVPEPATWSLAACALAGIARGRRRRSAIVATTVATLLVAHAENVVAQLPPPPKHERQELFDSFADFKQSLLNVGRIEDAGQRTQELDALWARLKSAGQIPYVQGSQVAFVYRGPADTVSVAGDFNSWNPNAESSQAERVAKTDVLILERTFPDDARLDYKLVINGSSWTLDPANPLQMWSGVGGPNSELRMPGYRYPEETIRRSATPRGRLSENVAVASRTLGYDVNYRVYMPATADAQTARRLPVVYATDGHEYAADHLGSLVVVLDNMIAEERIQPTIAVFVDPRDPRSVFNRRAEEYRENSAFVEFLADELAPTIDAAYPTRPDAEGRVILGTSLGGLNAAWCGATRPDVFGKVAVQSPASFAKHAPKTLERLAAIQPERRPEFFITAGAIGDGDAAPALAKVLAENGYQRTLFMTNEGHSWGNFRATLDDILVALIGPPL